MTVDPKMTEEEAHELWEKARRNAVSGNCVFSGWQFPADPDHDRGFLGITFRETARFEGAVFRGKACFLKTTFCKGAHFMEARFQGHAIFEDSAFENECSFRDTRFEQDVFFHNTVFGAYTSFEKAIFQGSAIFSSVAFDHSVNFRGAVFHSCAEFGEALCNAKAYFDLPEQDCGDARDRSPTPFRMIGAGETAYRLAKQCEQNRGNYQGAGCYHYAEQAANSWSWCKAVAWQPWQKTFWTWRCPRITWFFGDLVFGYGEKPFRPFRAWFVVILVCAAFYWIGGLVTDTRMQIVFEDTQPTRRESAVGTPEPTGMRPVPFTVSMASEPVITHDPWNSLYFSVVTFTTLGYGDIRPREGLIRAVAGCEALAGAALMSLFIVALARKFTR